MTPVLFRRALPTHAIGWAKELTLKAGDLNSPWGTQADDWVKIRGERLSKSTEGAAMGGHADATS